MVVTITARGFIISDSLLKVKIAADAIIKKLPTNKRIFKPILGLGLRDGFDVML